MNTRDASASLDKAMRRSLRPWDSAPSRPSLYAHYKKLVHDYDNLDEDLEQSRLVQQELEAQLQRHHCQVEAHLKKQRDQEIEAWERERERRVEDICVHSLEVETLKRQQATLEDEEIRLQAELEVIHERQQQDNETEAKKIFDLVHHRTSLLEEELAKGQMDMEFLTQVVTTSRRRQDIPGNEGNTLHSLVAAVQKRRQECFREATAQFQERLLSFEREKEALKQKADEIKWKKQRALQILSTNQQQVIADFFTTPRAAVQDANPPMPSLEFSTIMEGMKQASGEAVNHLQYAEHSKATARRQLEEALAKAEENLQAGPKKLEALQTKMEDRQREAIKLNITSAVHSQGAYAGIWGIETYREDQFELVYYVRSMIFVWVDRAEEISKSQPETNLLQQEIDRYDHTRAALGNNVEREDKALWARQLACELESEVIREIAQSILDEQSFSARRVRDIMLSEINDMLQPSAQRSQGTTTKPAGNASSMSESLRLAMFGTSWDEVRRLRTESLRQLPKLLMRPADHVVPNPQQFTNPSQPRVLAPPSPMKKRFGVFSTSQKPAATSIESLSLSPATSMEPVRALTLHEPASVDQNGSFVLHLSTEIDISSTASNCDEVSSAEELFWQRQVSVSSSCFSTLAACGVISCIQLSSDARLLAVGTVDSEIMIFSIGDDEEFTPVAVRMVPPPKTNPIRITRLCFCGCFLISYNQLMAASLWSLSPPLPSSHGTDSFPPDYQKSKPTPLSLIAQLTPSELFEEPPVLSDVAERDAPSATARLKVKPPVAISSLNFFSSVTVVGQPTHVLCGASTGDILKLSAIHVAKTEQPRSTESARTVGSVNEAAFEAPLKRDIDIHRIDRVDGRCKREFFRHGHRNSVLFVSSVCPLISKPQQARLVSVDQLGGIALWLYTRESFSGFGWFTPECCCQLEISFTQSSALPGPSVTGDILQIMLTPDRKTLVVMAFAASSLQHAKNAPRGRLRFIQVDLSLNTISVKPVRLEIDLFGPIPPRFTVLLMDSPSHSAARPDSASLKRKSNAHCFLVLLMNNSLHVLSLRTGQQCRPEILLNLTPTKDGKAKGSKEPPLSFNSITSSSVDNSLVCIAGEQHRQIQLYRFRTIPLLQYFVAVVVHSVLS